jgi:hypothetical protein
LSSIAAVNSGSGRSGSFAEAALHINAIMSPIPTRVYKPATVTPRQTLAMTLSGWSLVSLPGTALLQLTFTRTPKRVKLMWVRNPPDTIKFCFRKRRKQPREIAKDGTTNAMDPHTDGTGLRFKRLEHELKPQFNGVGRLRTHISFTYSAF